jgi:hydrogenase nickel incorporation protein HypB
MQPRIVEVRKNVLRKNDLLAHDLRAAFERSGVFVVSLVSSPGTGKTALLEATLKLLSPEFRVATVVGDLATDRDARRLQQAGGLVRQITTGTVCHLDADMVRSALEGWELDTLDFLFIENVGNLVCPSSYDLGEGLRVVLTSVTEGEDKPLKYPTIFHSADLAIITKIDLADAVGFDGTALRRSIEEVRPGMETLELSARTGAGMASWIAKLEELRESVQRPARPLRSSASSADPGRRGFTAEDAED